MQYKLILVPVLTVFLASCGSDEAAQTQNSQTQTTEETAEKHILSNEQEALRMAKGVEDLLATEAEKKKAAINAGN